MAEKTVTKRDLSKAVARKHNLIQAEAKQICHTLDTLQLDGSQLNHIRACRPGGTGCRRRMAMIPNQEEAMTLHFKPHVIDTDLPPGLYAQTALADLDGDGRLEFITGQQYGGRP